MVARTLDAVSATFAPAFSPTGGLVGVVEAAAWAGFDAGCTAAFSMLLGVVVAGFEAVGTEEPTTAMGVPVAEEVDSLLVIVVCTAALLSAVMVEIGRGSPDGGLDATAVLGLVLDSNSATTPGGGGSTSGCCAGGAGSGSCSGSGSGSVSSTLMISWGMWAS